MEAALWMKKSTGNDWFQCDFSLHGPILAWSGKFSNSVTLNKTCSELKDIKFGQARQFVIEIVLSSGGIMVSASGEPQKETWLAALNKAKLDTTEVVEEPVKSESEPKTIDPRPSSLADSSSKLKKMESSETPAPMSLMEKRSLRTSVSVEATRCSVCDIPVYKTEQVIVDKVVMHKQCFQCEHCKRQLTMGNFACINSTLYCKAHYFELFSTNGGKYEKAFGDAGFEKKALNSYTPGELVMNPGQAAEKTKALGSITED
jgi:hypothetical protein